MSGDPVQSDAPDGPAATGVSRAVDGAERTVIAVLMFFVCLLLLLQTGTRLIGSAAFGWAEEAARYLFIWVVMLGSGFAVRHGAHILADVLRPKSNHVLALAWLVVLEGVVAAAAFALFIYGIQLTMISSNSAMVSLPLSMGYRNAAVPAGAALMVLFSLTRIAGMIRAMRVPGGPPAEAPPPVEMV